MPINAITGMPAPGLPPGSINPIQPQQANLGTQMAQAVSPAQGSSTANVATGAPGSAPFTPATTSGTGPFSSQYLESGADIFARNPDAMLADMLAQQFPNSNRGLGILNQLSPLADVANLIHFALNANAPSAGAGTNAAFLDWLGDFWASQMTPGQFTDVGTGFSNLFNPGHNTNLVAELAVGDPQQQSANFMRMAGALASAGMHPLFARSMMNRLGLAQQEFLGQAARGPIDPFYQWIQSNMPNFARMFPGQ